MRDAITTMFHADSNLEKTADMVNNSEVVRSLVLMELQQVNAGKIKDFNSVCDRLEEKYSKE